MTQVVAAQMSANAANISEALRQTFFRLDEDFLASRAYPESVRQIPLTKPNHNPNEIKLPLYLPKAHMQYAAPVSVALTLERWGDAVQVRASSGASGSMVFLDRRLHRVYLACSGGSNMILGELVHGLAVQVAEASFLTPASVPDSHSVCPVGTGRWKQQHLAGDLLVANCKPVDLPHLYDTLECNLSPYLS